VFSSKTPQSAPTFTVDGQVAKTWRYEKGKVKTDPSAASTAPRGVSSAPRPSASRSSTPERRLGFEQPGRCLVEQITAAAINAVWIGLERVAREEA
jgi:hypothetical protein